MPTGPRPDPPTRTCKVVFAGSYGEAVWNNVMWLFLTGSGEITSSDVQALSDAMSSAYGNAFQAVTNELWLFEQTQVTLYGPGDDTVDGYSASGVAGLHTGDSTPANIAVCISWRIAPHYRGGHPRTYLCGVPNDITGATSFAGSYLVEVQNAAGSFHNDVEDTGPIGDSIETVEHGVVSFVTDKEWRTPPIFRRIFSVGVDSRIDTQRRRLGPDRR